jgi:hypothetical protein
MKNKALLDPNFLKLSLTVSLVQNKASNQHIHLGLLYNLRYAITYKTRHKSRINIHSRDKIMLNSPEVHFSIKRQYPEVGHKKLF